MELAKNLQFHRKKRGLSQNDVAASLNLSRQSISKWENGHTYPDIEHLVLLSELYEVSMDELFCQSVKKSRQQHKKNEVVIDSNLNPRSVTTQKNGEQDTGLILLLLGIISMTVFPLGFILIPYILWQNNRCNTFFKLICILCFLSILLNLRSVYSYLTFTSNWGITTIELIE